MAQPTRAKLEISINLAVMIAAIVGSVLYGAYQKAHRAPVPIVFTLESSN